MGEKNLKGVTLTPLKKIAHPSGDVLHGLKSSEATFSQFGEAYFSTVKKNLIKGWKKHTRMTLNLIVPVGEIRFVLYDDRIDSETKGQFFEISLSQNNYQRLTVEPNIWMAFQGRDNNLNLLLNIANIEHDPSESLTKELEQITYEWK